MSNKSSAPILNKQQLEAVNTIDGNLLIVASAGTGKTTTIVERYANMIENHGFRPDEILMTTFTNKAAKDMIKKIKRRTGTEPPYVGTMHALFLKILRANASSISLNPYFNIIDESDKKKMIKEILKKEGIDIKGDNVRYFIRWIGKYKNRGILAENLSENSSIDDIKDEGIIEEAFDDDTIMVSPLLRKKVNGVYKIYEARLRKLNLIDLDDILLLTLKLLKANDKLRESYSNKFKAIMVDEAQDLNFVQIDIINMIKNNNLCVIGDECQNIYEWRGSSPELVFSFNKDQKSIILNDNYRSGRIIIESVNKVINAFQRKIDKKLICTKKNEGNIKIEEFDSSREESSYVINEIKRLIKEGTSKEDIAILFRTNNIGKALERELRKNKIPCHLSKSVHFFDREEIKDIVSFLRLKINPYSVIDFERVFILMNGLGKSTAKKFEEISIKNTCSMVEGLKYYSQMNLSQDKAEQISKLIGSIETFEKSPIEIFLKEFGYLTKLKAKYKKEPDKFQDKLENIETFQELFEEYGFSKDSIKDFLDGLIEIDKKEKSKDKITLSTIHGAKGLEWEHVFLISCNEEIIPHRSNLEPLKREGELRLFYVAISRAKNSLIITHYSENDWGKEFERSSFIDIIE